jgi:hypothetical protein
MASCDSAEKSASLSDLADVKHGSALVADKHEPKAGFRKTCQRRILSSCLAGLPIFFSTLTVNLRSTSGA